jgi:hypothetical protein
VRSARRKTRPSSNVASVCGSFPQFNSALEGQGRVPLDNFRDKAQAFGLASAAVLPYNEYAATRKMMDRDSAFGELVALPSARHEADFQAWCGFEPQKG